MKKSNRQPVPARQSLSLTGKTEDFLSRGLMVRQISTAAGQLELRRFLNTTDLRWHKPFLLVVFQGVQPPLQWLWNGRHLEEHIAPFPVISTSSLLPSFTGRMRYRVFRNETNGFLKTLSGDRQRTLHSSRNPWPPAISMAMKRKDRGTVSLTRIRLDADNVHMTYQSGDPATTRETVYEHHLPVKSGSAARINTSVIHPQEKTAELSAVPDFLSASDTPGFKNAGETPDEIPTPSGATAITNSSGRYPANHRIDLSRILHEKNPQLAQKLPGWSVNLLKWVARETSVNRLVNNLQQVSSRNFAPTVLNHLGVQGSVTAGSAELPPPEKRPVFLANHPTGGIDGLLLLSWLLNHYPDVRMVVTDVLWKIPHLRPYIVPVDRYRKSRKSGELLLQAFESDTPLLIFPAGVTARKIKGRMQEASWQKMSVKLARQTERCIVPIHIDGYNSGLFYGLARLRRLAGIKLNLEMLLLVREFFNPACRMFSVTAGPAYTVRQIGSLGNNDTERISALQQICEELPENIRDVPEASIRIPKPVAT